MSAPAIRTLEALLAADGPAELDDQLRVAIRKALARAWIDQARADEGVSAESAEAALQTAAELDPAVGQTALARLLQRQRRWSKSAAAWRAVIARDPADSTAYLNLARVQEQAGEPDRALETYLELIDAVPSARSYLTVANRLAQLASRLAAPAPHRVVRIALIGNATLDHLASYVSVECFRAGLRPAVYVGGFDLVNQEILNPASGLYAFEPDVLICAIHPSRLFPRAQADPSQLSTAERASEIEDGLAQLRGLLDAFTTQSGAMVLLHNMAVPQHPALGTLDWREPVGQATLFADINRRIAELVRTQYRSVYVVDEERVQARVGKARAADPRLWLSARVPWSDELHLGLAREYLRFLKPLRGLTRKCIVLDLDNTLWGGVIGEDGVDGVQLGSDAPGNAFVAFQRELERLWRRGILLAVCSKNTYADVVPMFEHHPHMVLSWSHIAAYRINWQPKAANLRELAQELNIGIDSLVFLDDNPVERAAVRSELPDVLVPEWPTDPALYRTALLDLDVFESLALTAEDRQRGQLYAEQAQRRAFEASVTGRSIEDYLGRLEMVVTIEAVNPSNLARIAQLTNKTNQFNVTTRRYSEADLLARTAAGAVVLGLHVRDKFGDNGLTGVIIVDPADGDVQEIDSLLLSCRVMGRGVENALVALVAETAHAVGTRTLRGRFIPTAKNEPAADCYARLGFTRLPDAAGTEIWELDLGTQSVPVPTWLEVITPAVDLVAH